MYCILFLYQYNEDKKREKQSRTETVNQGSDPAKEKARSAQNTEDRPMGAFEKGAVPL